MIDVKKIIKERDLDKKEIAEQLFPGIKYPQLALNRIFTGEALLNSEQISKLALIANLSISELYAGPTKNWTGRAVKNILIFNNGEYRAELDRDLWITKIFHKNSLFHESIIHSNSISVNNYIKLLDNLIIKHNEKINKSSITS